MLSIKRRFFLLSVFAAALVCGHGGWAAETAAPAAAVPAAPQQVWLLSTRCGGCGDCGNAVTYSLWDGCSQWLPSDAAAFAAADNPAIPTIFTIHGNRTDACQAVEMGLQVYSQLKCLAGDRVFRLVIWSWPADRIRGPLNDVRTKACRSDVEAVLLAQTVSTINPEVRVSFIGYSFGARAITGALHMLGGGCLDGHALAQAGQRAPMRAMLLAAALDADWLLPGHRNDKALSQTEQMFITCNGSDPALMRYDLIYGSRCGPDALGYTGPACCGSLGGDAQKLEVVDVSCQVGRTHDWDLYFGAGAVQCRLGWYALVQPAATADAKAKTGDKLATTAGAAK